MSRHGLSAGQPLGPTIRASNGFVGARHPATLPGVQDIALDPVTGDLDLSSGGLRLTEPGSESIAQRLRVRLRLWLGEYLLDIRVGIPYQRLLGSKDDGPDGLEATLRAAVTTCPGIAKIETWSYELTPEREAIVSFVARTTDGEPVEVGAFNVGSLSGVQ